LSIGIQINKYQSIDGLYGRSWQQGLTAFVESIFATVCLCMKRQPDQLPIIAIRPTMIRAPEMRRIADFCPANLHSTMQTHVEHDPNGPAFVP
jgi:hypothetical protein